MTTTTLGIFTTCTTPDVREKQPQLVFIPKNTTTTILGLQRLQQFQKYDNNIFGNFHNLDHSGCSEKQPQLVFISGKTTTTIS